MPTPKKPTETSENGWLLECLSTWASHADRHGFRSKFSTISAAFGESVEALTELDLQTAVDEEIIRAKEKLAVGIEDYGIWRATRGNPDYSAYVAARQGASTKIDGLTKIASLLPDLTKALKDYVERFGSMENLGRVCQSYRKLLELVGRQSLPDAIYVSAELAVGDISLCLAWDGHRVSPKTRISATQLIQQNLTSYEACRLLSARAAELAAITYYAGLGFSVEDVSIRQLGENDDRWKNFDLIAGEQTLDVKNARSSFTSPDAYVEHCVPRFKLNRETHNEVSIVGVLSPYIIDPESIITGEEKCLILGQVNVTEIRKLYQWMRSRFGVMLNLDGVWNPGFLPGWIFEYPDEQYKSRAEIRNAAKHLLDAFQQADFRTDLELPMWLLGLEPGHPAIRVLKLPSHYQKVLSDLASLDEGIGIKRASLYVYSMGFLLEAMLNESDPGAAFDALSRIIFADNEQGSPLCLIDTQAYLKNLVRMLSEVHAEVKQQQLSFQAFQMPHPGILRGQLRDGLWMTLIAYCGGWLEEPFRVKCGASPLFFGHHENCLACGRLVCTECGFCSKNCDLYFQRRENLAQYRKEHPYYFLADADKG